MVSFYISILFWRLNREYRKSLKAYGCIDTATNPLVSDQRLNWYPPPLQVTNPLIDTTFCKRQTLQSTHPLTVQATNPIHFTNLYTFSNSTFLTYCFICWRAFVFTNGQLFLTLQIMFKLCYTFILTLQCIFIHSSIPYIIC